MSTTTAPTVEQTVERMKREIVEGILDGTFPADVASFSTLHDYCDANCLGGLCDDDVVDSFGTDDAGNDAWMTHGNKAQDAVHEWLVAGRPSTVVVLSPEAFSLLSTVLDFHDDDEELAENADEPVEAVRALRDAVAAARQAV